MAALIGLSSLSVAELWHLGRKQYQDGLYKPALKTFTALAEKEAISIELSELLAATYAKQQVPAWDNAMKWGRQAIILDRRDARGYLCTAKILIKMNQRKRAIALYDVGIEKCRPEDPNLPRLVKSRDAATGTKVAPSHRDPLSILPPELILDIFHRLEFKKMVKCLRVSKAWKAFLTSWPELWKLIELGPNRNIRSSFVKACVKYSGYKLESASLGAFSHFGTFISIAKCCPRLRSLEISQNNTIATEQFLQVLDKTSSLQFLTIGTPIRSPFMPHILKILPRLAEVRFLSVVWMADGAALSSPLGLPRHETLQHFECCMNPAGYQRPLTVPLGTDIFNANFANSPNMKSIKIENMRLGSGCDFRLAKSLVHIQLVNCHFNASFAIEIPTVWFPEGLRVLQISGARGMKFLEQNLPHLDRLEIGDCSKPQEIVENLLHEGPILENEVPAQSLDTNNMWADPDMHRRNHQDQQTKITPYQGFSKLKTFKVESKAWLATAYNSIMRREDDLELALTHPRLSETENIVLIGSGIDDNLIESVLEERRPFTRNLAQVAFDSARISSISIRLLIEQEKKLKVIWLVNCESVGSDVVEWAQRRGVIVQIRRK